MLPPSPRPGEHSPGTPILTNLCSFPSGTPASRFIVPGAHRPPEAPLPCGCTRFPPAPWHPLGSQLSRPMSLRFPVPTTLAESCPGSQSRGPLALVGTRGASEGTAGALAPLSATHVVLGLRGVGGEEVLVGTLRSRRRASSLAVPGLTAGVRGPSCCRSSPRPRGWGDPG